MTLVRSVFLYVVIGPFAGMMALFLSAGIGDGLRFFSGAPKLYTFLAFAFGLAPALIVGLIAGLAETLLKRDYFLVPIAASVFAALAWSGASIGLEASYKHAGAYGFFHESLLCSIAAAAVWLLKNCVLFREPS